MWIGTIWADSGPTKGQNVDIRDSLGTFVVVCEECETSVDKFNVISTQINTRVQPSVVNAMRRSDQQNEYRRQLSEASDLKISLEAGIFEEYNQVRKNYMTAMARFEALLQTLARDSKHGRDLHILDIYHYIGSQLHYNQIFPQVLRNAVVANGVELETSQWRLEGDFSISPFRKLNNLENQELILRRFATHLRKNPPKDLADTTEKIVSIMREISENHIQNWEVNHNTNHPEVLGQLKEIEFSAMREVKEFCPACGSLEWQGIHVEVKLTIHDSEAESGTQHEYSGRITELNQQFVPDIIKAAQQNLDQLEKRIAAFEKFNQEIEKKVKRRIKKKADAKKRAEIKALKAKLKELEDE